MLFDLDTMSLMRGRGVAPITISCFMTQFYTDKKIRGRGRGGRERVIKKMLAAVMVGESIDA